MRRLGLAAALLGACWLVSGCTGEIEGDADGNAPASDARVDADPLTPDGSDRDAPGVDAASSDAAPSGSDHTPPEFLACDSASGEIVDANPGNYRSLLDAMQPGDTLRLAAGTYDQGLPITDMNGSAGSCYVIEGPSSAPYAVFTGSSSRNTVSIRDSSFVVVRNLELDGLGLEGDGVKAEGDATFAHHIRLENLYIHDYDANQQIVGISTKCTAWNWVIRGNRVVHAGTGLYLGNSDGSAPFVNGLIEGNVVLDTIGHNMEIKHQNPRPNLTGLPSSGITWIRHNVFSKASNASTGGDARPNLLLGHWPLSGDGVDDQYLVYGNFFFENPVEALMQAEGNVAVYSNLFVNSAGSAVNIQPHNDVPRRIHIFFNTVVASETGIRVTGGDNGFDQIVAGNASFAGTPLSGGEQRDNATDTRAAASGYLEAPFLAPGAGLNLHPLAGALDDGADTTGLDAFAQWNQDFERRLRSGSYRGAYEGSADGTSWPLALDRKP